MVDFDGVGCVEVVGQLGHKRDDDSIADAQRPPEDQSSSLQTKSIILFAADLPSLAFSRYDWRADQTRPS